MNLVSSRIGVIHRFSSKRGAAAWLREQGFVRLQGAFPGVGGGWRCGERQARWIPWPDQKPAGVLVVSELRSGVCHG